ncbi:MAG: hypothetical protein V7K38_13405 [Nostoc sp.]
MVSAKCFLNEEELSKAAIDYGYLLTPGIKTIPGVSKYPGNTRISQKR